MDPTTARTEGNESLKRNVVTKFIFENCSERQAKDQSIDLKCRDQGGVRQWLTDNKPKLLLIYAFNYVNLGDPDQPFQTTISRQLIGLFDYEETHDYQIPLKLHQLDLVDDIIDPFQLSSVTIDYITT